MGTLLSGDGRSNRSMWWLIHFIVMGCLYLTVLTTCAVLTSESSTHEIRTLMLPAALVGGILMIWTLIALSVRRLHDMGQTGFWLVLALIPVIGQLGLVVILGLKAGHDGDNAFGAAPMHARERFNLLKKTCVKHGERVTRLINRLAPSDQ
ncbi:MAG: DUF805 domain-containing protein [Pseudomonadota bacterium]